MTLTLDDVRNMKFRMARRTGYEVIDVDQFVDQVEEAFAQLTDENEQLKKQVETLQVAAAQQKQDAAASPEQGSGSGPTAGQGAQESQFATPQGIAAQQAPQQTPQANDSQAASDQGDAGTSQAQSAGAGAGAETVVVTTSAEASAAVVRMVQLHTESADRAVSEAREQSEGIVADAQRQAHEITTDARTKAERIESEARVNAERVRSDADGRAAALDQELKDHRVQALATLESERDSLTDSVTKLRSWEKKYRGSMTDHLKSQLSQLESGTFEPDNAPELGSNNEQGSAGNRARSGGADGGSQQSSDTPRLDALLGEQKS